MTIVSARRTGMRHCVLLGADKYNPLVYTMTAGACLVYVVNKLVWFFHQRHQPAGDEDADEEMDEIVPSTN